MPSIRITGSVPVMLATVAVAGCVDAAIAAKRSGEPPVRYRPVGCLPRGLGVAHFNGPAKKIVALSFDDGPSSYTRSFVRMLRANHAVATFFVIGEQVGRRYRSIMRTELRDGDAIGDHTWSHPNLIQSSEVRGQLQNTIDAVRAMTGYAPCVFRPPYGAYDANVVHAASSLHLATILWNVDPVDWARPGVAAIEQRVVAQVRPGSIILSHDGGGNRSQTLAAYPYIIDALRRRGYRLVTVPQLLGYPTVYQACTVRCFGTSRATLPAKAVVR